MAINLKMMMINGKDLADVKGELTLTREMAVKEGKIIGIAPSQVIDWLYELRNTSYEQMCEQVSELKQQMKKAENHKVLKQQIDELVFIDELVRVRFSRQADFKKYGKGFTLNGRKYVFILNKGDETITYIREDLFDLINKKIEGSRDVEYKLVPAKLNAYRSLAMSTSKAVTDTDKVIVVKDCYKKLFQKYLYVEASTLQIHEREEWVSRNINDGYGFVSPQLAHAWSQDLGHDVIDSAFQVRNLYCKGILATFDFVQFAMDHNTFKVVDYWGAVRDIRDAEIILSESMLKLAGAYSSCEEWLQAVQQHDYKWRVAKTSKKQKYGYTNYQQILPMSLDEEDCKELLSDSIKMLKDIHGGSYVATTLYLNGDSASSDNFADYNLAKLIQIEPELVNDYFINHKIQANTRRTKKELLTGRTLINSSFQVIVGDVIAFTQHILGLEPKGFLGEKEIYSAYHRKNGITEATAFRAPLLCENSIVKVKLNQVSDYDKYLTYLDDVYVTSSVDLLNESLCGFDYDGDTIQLITAPSIVRKTKNLLPLICEGVSANKQVCDMNNLFGSCELGVKGAKKYNIGSCINKASSFFATRSQFAEGSAEYKELSDRIMLSQAISQSYIDYRKSGSAFEMPKHWSSQKGIDMLDIELQDFNQRILSNKKPIFMKNLYANQSGKQNDLWDMLNLKSMALFGITADELLAMNQEDMTANQRTLVYHFIQQSQFNLCDNSTMSVWERQAGNMLKEVKNHNTTKSTGELLKAGVAYDKESEKEVRELLLTYNNKVQSYKANLVNVESDSDRRLAMSQAFISEAKEQLYFDLLDVCDNDVVVTTDVMITVCYGMGRCCDLLFELFGEQIYDNVKSRKSNVNTIVADDNGNYSFKYKNYSIEKVEIQK